MADGFGRTRLPFINQSIARQLRSGAFRTKAPVGPATSQAITEGALEQDRISAQEQASLFAQIAENKRQADQSAELERSRLAESQRQADISADISRERLAAEKAAADQVAAQARKTRKASEPSFFTGLFGS